MAKGDKGWMWTSMAVFGVSESCGKRSIIRIPRHILFNNGHVHATETRPQKKSSAPNSMGAISHSQSGLLARARNEDARAYDELIVVVARLVKAQGWQIKGREAELSKIILSGCVFDDQIRSAEAGRMLGISRQSYEKHWKSKVSEIQVHIVNWQNN